MDEQHYEMARQAEPYSAVLSRGGGQLRFVGSNGAALVASVRGLVVYLLATCVDPEGPDA